MVSQSLQDWSFSEHKESAEWIPCSQFPTTVHVELLKLGRIPDPFIGLNEWDVQWVGEKDWVFKSSFAISSQQIQASNLDLVFDGLDTFATVFFNEHNILESDNQFLAYRIPIKKHAKEGDNELKIIFQSAFRKGRATEKEHGKLNLWNGDSSRLHVRKAQYNYGWDWGPVLMTVGPWKPVQLDVYENRLEEVYVKTTVSETLSASIAAQVTTSASSDALVTLVLKDPEGKVEFTSSKTSVQADSNTLNYSFGEGAVRLWYPIGYGEQPTYIAELTLEDANGNILDTKSQKIGFRRARVIQEKLVDQEGLSFFFEINNIRIFCGGSNWIPADSFLTTVTPDRYRAWLQLLVDGNQNMIRVWGGGIYEFDCFYDICDELGILVWQDFMFGCGQYPAYDSFVKSVEEEAKQNVIRLRHHPSVVIFAGNNEDYALAESLKLELDYSDETSDFRKTNFPARYIYERVLPKVVEEHSDIFYHRSSPYSGHGKPSSDQTFGDIHQWNVWHGSQEPWHRWDVLAGRFVSEFGMQGYPNIRTVDYWIGEDKSEGYPQSKTNTNHNKADGFERRLELYLVENFKHTFEMKNYVYYTQVMQAETLASAYRLWRRNWRGPGKEYTSGALVWQINDCWPVTSWAIVDYFLRPKPAYFAIARELRTYTVGMARSEKTTFPDELSADNFTIDTILEIWGTNSSLERKNVQLEVVSFDLQSDWRDKWSKDVTLEPNSSTELFKGNVPGQPQRTRKSQVPKDIIVSARLIDADGKVLGRYSNWPEPFKFIHFPKDVGLKVQVADDGETVVLSSQKPIKGIVLDVDGEDVKWSDQGIDLVPDDPQSVKAFGLGGRAVKVRYLGDESV